MVYSLFILARFCVGSLFCFPVLSVLPCFAIMVGRESWLHCFICLQCIVAVSLLSLPHGAVGWSALCDGGIS